MSEENLRAILWDLDGTLIDSEPYWMAAEQQIVAECGGTWSVELAQSCVGNSLPSTAELIRQASARPLPNEVVVTELVRRVRTQIEVNIPWRPGARELLVAASSHQLRCALVTMSLGGLVDAVLQHLPTGVFQAVVSGDQVQHAKPHPEPYQRAIAQLALTPLECVAIEDSPTGAQSATSAGVPTVVVPHVVDVPHQAGMVKQVSLKDVDVATLRRLWSRARSAS